MGEDTRPLGTLEASQHQEGLGPVKGDALVLEDMQQRLDMAWRKKTRCRAPVLHARVVVTMATCP